MKLKRDPLRYRFHLASTQERFFSHCSRSDTSDRYIVPDWGTVGKL